MAPNAADRKSIRAQEKAARLAERQREEVLTSVMSTLAGRVWFWDLLGSCHIFHSTFNGDALGGAFAEGQRSIGLAILADIMRSCPDLYIQAMREANERHISDDRRTDDPASGAALAERPGSAQPDGGDSGAGADSADPGGDSGSEAEPAEWRSPGRDIYVERPQG